MAGWRPNLKRDSQRRAISQFWRWWPGVRGPVEAAIASGQWDDLNGEVNARVAAIHPDLQWEFAKGVQATQALVVCPAGDARLRAAAARWRAAAPEADGTWEYHSARQPDPAAFAATLDLAGRRIPLKDTRFAFTLDTDRCQIDVVCYHPVFALVDEQIRLQVTFLALDWLLGEEAVELWIGGVEPSTVPPAHAQPPQSLANLVAQVATQYAKPRWALLSGRDKDGYPMIATIQQPLKPARWPRFDTHIDVTLAYESSDVGLPTDTALSALRSVEDAVTAALGTNGALVAHESTRGMRTLHLYADAESAVEPAVRRALDGWAGRKPVIQHGYDPEFLAVSHLRS